MVADGTCQYHFALSAFTRTERMELCLKIAALGGVYNENTVSYLLKLSSLYILHF